MDQQKVNIRDAIVEILAEMCRKVIENYLKLQKLRPVKGHGRTFEWFFENVQIIRGHVIIVIFKIQSFTILVFGKKNLKILVLNIQNNKNGQNWKYINKN